MTNSLYRGAAFTLQDLGNKMLELVFNLDQSSTNVLGGPALEDLGKVLSVLKAQVGVKALLVSSAKDQFVVGADIFEFMGHFKKSQDQLQQWISQMSSLFNQLEDLPYPTAVAINGLALGGGFELALAADYRVMDETAKVGLPETTLGIIPGWGGTVRLPRLTGADHALEWITTGKQFSAKEAYSVRAVDAVVAKGTSRQGALTLLERAQAGELDWKQQRARKLNPIKLNKTEAPMVFENALGMVMALGGKNFPALGAVVQLIKKSAFLSRDQACELEAQTFAQLSKTTVASSLVCAFLGDQALKKNSKKLVQSLPAAEQKISSLLVCGAGIMGSGIAYQAASRGVEVRLFDNSSASLLKAKQQVKELILKGAEKGKIKPEAGLELMANVQYSHELSSISAPGNKVPQLVIEAIIEKQEPKMELFASLERELGDRAILATNTSSFSVATLGSKVKSPELFCGLHFFNPVIKMPLVEVIKTDKTSPATLAKAVSFVSSIGKTPLVVKDCAGFLVNRILFPYFFAFDLLASQGVDLQQIESTMEKFGFPMGPSLLIDVVGLDTSVHAAEVIAKAYAPRMTFATSSLLHEMTAAQWYGQKNGQGFYLHSIDAKGKPQKKWNPAVGNLVAKVKEQFALNFSGANRLLNSLQMTPEVLTDLLMLPMIFEAARCLEEKVVDSAIEVDMGLLLGLGFPAFRFGALKYGQDRGWDHLVERAHQYRELGGLYQVPEIVQQWAKDQVNLY